MFFVKTVINYNYLFHAQNAHIRPRRNKVKYCKIPIISPGLIFVQKAFFAGLIFGRAYFRRGLLLEGILRFKMGWP